MGEITKFVVESNYGMVYLGHSSNEVYTKEIVVKSNSGKMHLFNRMDRVEIQQSTDDIVFFGRVAEHVDVKKSSGFLLFYYFSSTE